MASNEDDPKDKSTPAASEQGPGGAPPPAPTPDVVPSGGLPESVPVEPAGKTPDCQNRDEQPPPQENENKEPKRENGADAKKRNPSPHGDEGDIEPEGKRRRSRNEAFKSADSLRALAGLVVSTLGGVLLLSSVCFAGYSTWSFWTFITTYRDPARVKLVLDNAQLILLVKGGLIASVVATSGGVMKFGTDLLKPFWADWEHPRHVVRIHAPTEEAKPPAMKEVLKTLGAATETLADLAKQLAAIVSRGKDLSG